MQKFEDHVGMIHKVTKKAFARASALGAGLDYEDIFQEASVAFVKARDTFKPEMGFQFSTYFYRIFFNHFERVIQSEERFFVELGATSLEAMTPEDSDSSPLDFMCGHNQTPEAIVAARQEIERHQYSDVAKRIMEMLVDTPQEVIDEIKRVREHTKLERNWGDIGVSGDPTMNEICDLMASIGVNEKSIKKAKNELIALSERL